MNKTSLDDFLKNAEPVVATDQELFEIGAGYYEHTKVINYKKCLDYGVCLWNINSEITEAYSGNYPISKNNSASITATFKNNILVSITIDSISDQDFVNTILLDNGPVSEIINNKNFTCNGSSITNKENLYRSKKYADITIEKIERSGAECYQIDSFIFSVYNNQDHSDIYKTRQRQMALLGLSEI